MTQVLFVFQTWSHAFALVCLKLWSSYLCLLNSWDHRQVPLLLALSDFKFYNSHLSPFSLRKLEVWKRWKSTVHIRCSSQDDHFYIHVACWGLGWRLFPCRLSVYFAWVYVTKALGAADWRKTTLSSTKAKYYRSDRFHCLNMAFRTLKKIAEGILLFLSCFSHVKPQHCSTDACERARLTPGPARPHFPSSLMNLCLREILRPWRSDQ
jgi:hypothetical protein